MRKVKNIKAIIIFVVVALTLVASMLMFQYKSSTKVVTVLFDTDGGSSIATQIVNSGDMVSKPDDPVKEGYKFLYWELDGKEFDFSNFVINDLELIAKWEVDKIGKEVSEIRQKTIETGNKGSETKLESDVTTSIETKTYIIGYKTVTQYDSNLEKGKTTLIQEGQNGEVTITYRVTYTSGKETSRTETSQIINKQSINKIVHVGTKEKIDRIAPIITLLGNKIEYVVNGASYNDAGAIAADDVDGDITGKIAVAGDTVDTTIAGTNVVTYNVSDAAGNLAAEVTRIVIVAQKIDVGWIVVEPTSIMAGLENFPVLIDATIYPENASNKNIVWSSSNPSVVTVVDGQVTILDYNYKGIVIITATTIDGNKTAITIVSNNISAAENRAFWSFNEVYRSDRFDKLDFTNEEDLRYMGDMLNSDHFDRMAENLPSVVGKDVFLEKFTSIRNKVNVAREPFDILQIETAKELIAGATYTMTQEEAIDEAIIKSTIEDIIDNEISVIPFYNEVVVTVNKVDYIPAVAADAVDSAGIDGTYTFTVDLRMLNSLASDSTESLTMTITAAPFVERIK